MLTASRRARARDSTDKPRHLVEQVDELLQHVRVGAHIFRLFLYPDDIGGVFVPFDLGEERVPLERVELLDSDERRVGVPILRCVAQ